MRFTSLNKLNGGKSPELKTKENKSKVQEKGEWNVEGKKNNNIFLKSYYEGQCINKRNTKSNYLETKIADAFMWCTVCYSRLIGELSA